MALGVPYFYRLRRSRCPARETDLCPSRLERQAALYLKRSREELEKANALIADSMNEEAARVLDRSLADSELALALATEAHQ
jgi:hypothetical protein